MRYDNPKADEAAGRADAFAQAGASPEDLAAA
jgi:hypothetical protein